MPVSLALIGGALLITMIVGVGLGIASAVRAPGKVARATDVVSLFGLALPTFWLGLILVSLISLRMRLFPASGWVSFSTSPLDWFRSLVLPCLTLAAAPAGVLAKQTRDAMLGVLGLEYIQVLRANGVTERSIVFRHALKNAALPVVTQIGLLFVALIGGTVVVEQLFALPGLGKLAVDAASQHDLPTITGVTLVFVLLVIICNLVVDSLYGWLNRKASVTT
jgi:peptide/nickel transport system permease protein